MFAQISYHRRGLLGIVDVAAYRANPASGGCPVIDLSKNLCAYGQDGTIGCNALRECDAYTGNTHFEYSLPGGPSGNVDIAVYNSATGNAGYVYAPGVQQDVAEINAAILANTKAVAQQQAQAAGTPVTSSVVNSSSVPVTSTNANAVTPGNPVSNAVSSLTQVGSSAVNWFEGSMVGGIPNWLLVVGGLGALLLLGKGKL